MSDTDFRARLRTSANGSTPVFSRSQWMQTSKRAGFPQTSEYYQLQTYLAIHSALSDLVHVDPSPTIPSPWPYAAHLRPLHIGHHRLESAAPVFQQSSILASCLLIAALKSCQLVANTISIVPQSKAPTSYKLGKTPWH